MARISMRNVQKSTVSQYFDLYLSAAAARGVKDKTLQTYKQHFQSIAKRLDVTVPMNRLNSADLDKMILGLPEDQYTQYYFHQLSYQTEDGSWSLGEAVYNRLKEKERIMLDAIDNHTLEAMPTSDEDLEMIFSKL